MGSLTENEGRVVEYLFRYSDENISINMLANKVGLSPPGTMKILKKLKAEGILKSKKAGLADFYRIDFRKDKAINLVKFVLSGLKVQDNIKPYINDLNVLRGKVKMCILFGSILKDPKAASDIDIISVIEKSDYGHIKKKMREIESSSPKKIHAVMQTPKDLMENIKAKDKVVLNAIKTGIILWGIDYVIEGIKKWEG